MTMIGMITILAVGLSALIVLALSVAVVTARRTARADETLRLPEMMRLRGALPPEPLTKAAVHDAANAGRRCLACGAKAMCAELLAGGCSEGYMLFCPNAHYIEQLRSRLL
jgi:hypothetical protein